jgi:hypothetical protein
MLGHDYYCNPFAHHLPFLECSSGLRNSVPKQDSS